MTPLEYWRDGHGLPHITPPGVKQPESDEFFEKLTRKLFKQQVVEFGCGVGRLAPYFDPDLYLGMDICPAALKRARLANRDHAFMRIFNGEMVSARDAIFAHTVMLHVPDEELINTCRQFAAPMVVISEILGRNWRREGNPPVFNREINEYEHAMKVAGFRLHRVEHAPYPHYKDTDVAILEFHQQ